MPDVIGSVEQIQRRHLARNRNIKQGLLFFSLDLGACGRRCFGRFNFGRRALFLLGNVLLDLHLALFQLLFTGTPILELIQAL